jgi:hypothetical protein
MQQNNMALSRNLGSFFDLSENKRISDTRHMKLYMETDHKYTHNLIKNNTHFICEVITANTKTVWIFEVTGSCVTFKVLGICDENCAQKIV